MNSIELSQKLHLLMIPKDFKEIERLFSIYTYETITIAIDMINNDRKRALLRDLYDEYLDNQVLKQESIDNN